MSEKFTHLALKNWDKYQPENKRSYPWIRDYKDKDFDRDISKLTVFQRGIWDMCCRLRGRLGKNLSNDPQWIVGAVSILPQERRNAISAIGQLIAKGFLIPTNQPDSFTPLEVKKEKREEEKRIEEVKTPARTEKIPDDSDVKIEQIAKAHPKHRKPAETEREIVMQLDRLGDQMGVQSALKYLLERTLRYAQAYKRWPEDRQRFSPESPRWFHSACFSEDPSVWELEENQKGSLKDRLDATDRIEF